MRRDAASFSPAIPLYTANDGWTFRFASQVKALVAFSERDAPRYLLRDRDARYGNEFRSRVQSLGMNQVITAARSPGRTRLSSARSGRFDVSAWTMLWF